jgi:hypothetical protein
MEIGLDKLILTTTDFRVKNWGLLNHNPRKGIGKEDYKKQKEDIILVDSTGDPCYHKNLFWNPSGNQDKQESKLNMTIGERGLQIILNPSKFDTDKRHHIHPVDDHHILTERVKHSLDFIHQNLGVDFDQSGLKIYRMDLCRNIKANQPVGSYRPVFDLLSLSRSQYQKSYPSGYTDSNSTKALVIYDKIGQILEDKDWKNDKAIKSQLFDTYGNNLMRLELQLKKQAVKGNLGISRLGDIDKVGFPYLQDKYKDFMRNQVFKIKVLDTGVIPYSNLLNLMHQMRSIKTKGWLQLFFQVYGIELVLEQSGGINQILDAYQEISGHRMSRNRASRQIRELLMIKSSLVKTQGLSSMYDEIYRKSVA